MQLNDKQITAEVKIEPFVDRKVEQEQGQKVLSYGLDSFGYGLRLAEEARAFITEQSIYIGVDIDRTHPVYIVQSNDKRYLRILSQQTILVTTVEALTIPDDCIGVFFGKSTYARSGIISYTTVFEPGWTGRPTIMLHNTRMVTCYLPIGEGIGQMVFFRGEPPSFTYSGKYQGDTGVRNAK